MPDRWRINASVVRCIWMLRERWIVRFTAESVIRIEVRHVEPTP